MLIAFCFLFRTITKPETIKATTITPIMIPATAPPDSVPDISKG